jgi:O-antigen/teichoic acid export membrane protein
MTPEQLAAIAGVVLSLAFSYVPGLSQWYDTLDGDHKRLIMLGSLFVVAAGALGLSCASLLAVFACTWAGAWQALLLFLSAAIANQMTFLVSPGISARREALKADAAEHELVFGGYPVDDE